MRGLVWVLIYIFIGMTGMSYEILMDKSCLDLSLGYWFKPFIFMLIPAVSFAMFVFFVKAKDLTESYIFWPNKVEPSEAASFSGMLATAWLGIVAIFASLVASDFFDESASLKMLAPYVLMLLAAQGFFAIYACIPANLFVEKSPQNDVSASYTSDKKLSPSESQERRKLAALTTSTVLLIICMFVFLSLFFSILFEA